jgi:hypothetical protein
MENIKSHSEYNVKSCENYVNFYSLIEEWNRIFKNHFNKISITFTNSFF